MPSGPLAILPLTENRSAIVWSEDKERAAEIMDPSAANTRTWPTRRIISGASREPIRKPAK